MQCKLILPGVEAVVVVVVVDVVVAANKWWYILHILNSKIYNILTNNRQVSHT